jgi:hypothetical protein
MNKNLIPPLLNHEVGQRDSATGFDLFFFSLVKQLQPNPDADVAFSFKPSRKFTELLRVLFLSLVLTT